METNEIWNKQPVLTDADITAEAIRLGLLPVRPPSAIGADAARMLGTARQPTRLHPICNAGAVWCCRAGLPSGVCLAFCM